MPHSESLAAVKASDDDGRPASSPALSPETSQLLWVDDSRMMLSLYKAVFESMGFEVWATTSPKQALDRASSTPISVVILDYAMPEMDGIELACLIKKRHPMLPVILYSGSVNIPHRANDWVDAICAKAAPREELVATIERLLDQNGSNRTLPV